MREAQEFLLDIVEDNHQSCMERIRKYLYSTED